MLSSNYFLRLLFLFIFGLMVVKSVETKCGYSAVGQVVTDGLQVEFGCSEVCSNQAILCSNMAE